MGEDEEDTRRQVGEIQWKTLNANEAARRLQEIVLRVCEENVESGKKGKTGEMVECRIGRNEIRRKAEKKKVDKVQGNGR